MREFWRTMTGPKQGVYSVRRTRSAHRNASTNPSHHRSQILGRPRQIVSARWIALREVLSVPTEHGGRRPAALRQWIALLLSICASTLRFAQATKPATDWDASGNPGPVQIAEGLAAKINA